MTDETKELLERMRSPHNSLVTQSFLLNEGANVIEEQAKAIRANALETLQKQGQDCTRIEERQDRIEELEGKLLQFADLVIEELDVAALADCESGVASLNRQAAKEYLADFPHTFEAIQKIKDKAEEILDEIEDHDG